MSTASTTHHIKHYHENITVVELVCRFLLGDPELDDTFVSPKRIPTPRVALNYVAVSECNPNAYMERLAPMKTARNNFLNRARVLKGWAWQCSDPESSWECYEDYYYRREASQDHENKATVNILRQLNSTYHHVIQGFSHFYLHEKNKFGRHLDLALGSLDPSSATYHPRYARLRLHPQSVYISSLTGSEKEAFREPCHSIKRGLREKAENEELLQLKTYEDACPRQLSVRALQINLDALSYPHASLQAWSHIIPNAATQRDLANIEPLSASQVIWIPFSPPFIPINVKILSLTNLSGSDGMTLDLTSMNSLEEISLHNLHEITIRLPLPCRSSSSHSRHQCESSSKASHRFQIIDITWTLQRLGGIRRGEYRTPPEYILQPGTSSDAVIFSGLDSEVPILFWDTISEQGLVDSAHRLMRVITSDKDPFRYLVENAKSVRIDGGHMKDCTFQVHRHTTDLAMTRVSGLHTIDLRRAQRLRYLLLNDIETKADIEVDPNTICPLRALKLVAMSLNGLQHLVNAPTLALLELMYINEPSFILDISSCSQLQSVHTSGCKFRQFYSSVTPQSRLLTCGSSIDNSKGFEIIENDDIFQTPRPSVRSPLSSSSSFSYS